MKYKFLRQNIQQEYEKYLSKMVVSDDFLPFFVKIHKDYDWYYDFLEKKSFDFYLDKIEDKLLIELPVLLFLYVSNADNDIDIDEYNSFLFVLKKISKIDLYKKYIDDVLEFNKQHFNYKFIKHLNYSESELRNKLIYVNDILNTFSLDKRMKFLFIVKIIIRYISEASGKLFDKKGINRYEKKVLYDINNIFSLDILEDKSFKIIGSNKSSDISLDFSKNVDKKHIKVKIYDSTHIILEVTTFDFKSMLNKHLLVAFVPYIMGKEDILFIGDYVITFGELYHTIRYSKTFYKKKIINLNDVYEYSFNSSGISISSTFKSMHYGYFELVFIEEYLFYYENFIEEIDNDSLEFDNGFIYLNIVDNKVIKSDISSFDIKIEKKDNIFLVSSYSELYFNGEEISTDTILKDGDSFYLNNIKFKLLETKLYVELLTSYDIDIKNLTIKYGSNIIINDFNFKVDSSSMVCIMGPSGCGKSTLIDTLSYPNAIKKAVKLGDVQYNGKKLYENYEKIGKEIGFVSQDDVLFARLSVFENLKYYMLINGIKYDRFFLEYILDEIGLLSKKDLLVGDKKDRVLSGGQRKRLNIALELIKKPKVLFLDEPTSGLSSKDSESIVNLLKKISNNNVSIISVLHQPSDKIFRKFDKFLFLMEGYIAYFGTPNMAYEYFTTFNEYEDGSCPTPDIFFDISQTIEVDEYGYEVRVEEDGHLQEKKYKYTGKYLFDKYMEYINDKF